MHAQDPAFQIGDTVFVYMPASKQGEAYKFSKPLKAHLRFYHFMKMELIWRVLTRQRVKQLELHWTEYGNVQMRYNSKRQGIWRLLKAVQKNWKLLK